MPHRQGLDPVILHPSLVRAFGKGDSDIYGLHFIKRLNKWRIHNERVLVVMQAAIVVANLQGTVSTNLTRTYRDIAAIIHEGEGGCRVMIQSEGDLPDIVFRWKHDGRNASNAASMVYLIEHFAAAQRPGGIPVRCDPRLRRLDGTRPRLYQKFFALRSVADAAHEDGQPAFSPGPYDDAAAAAAAAAYDGSSEAGVHTTRLRGGGGSSDGGSSRAQPQPPSALRKAACRRGSEQRRSGSGGGGGGDGSRLSVAVGGGVGGGAGDADGRRNSLIEGSARAASELLSSVEDEIHRDATPTTSMGLLLGAATDPRRSLSELSEWTAQAPGSPARGMAAASSPGRGGRHSGGVSTAGGDAASSNDGGGFAFAPVEGRSETVPLVAADMPLVTLLPATPVSTQLSDDAASPRSRRSSAAASPVAAARVPRPRLPPSNAAGVGGFHPPSGGDQRTTMTLAAAGSPDDVSAAAADETAAAAAAAAAATFAGSPDAATPRLAGFRRVPDERPHRGGSRRRHRRRRRRGDDEASASVSASPEASPTPERAGGSVPMPAFAPAAAATASAPPEAPPRWATSPLLAPRGTAAAAVANPAWVVGGGGGGGGGDVSGGCALLTPSLPAPPPPRRAPPAGLKCPTCAPGSAAATLEATRFTVRQPAVDPHRREVMDLVDMVTDNVWNGLAIGQPTRPACAVPCLTGPGAAAAAPPLVAASGPREGYIPGYIRAD